MNADGEESALLAGLFMWQDYTGSVAELLWRALEADLSVGAIADVMMVDRATVLSLLRQGTD